MDKKLKLFVVEDHYYFRQGIKMTVEDFDFVDEVSEAENGKVFLAKLDGDNLPDIVLMDISMPEMDGIEATKIALEKYPGLSIVALSAFGEERFLQDMLNVGVKGFMLKNIDSVDLERALKIIQSGKSYFSEELLPYFTNRYLNSTVSQADNVHITQRELEVLKLVAQGLGTKDIADKLFVSERTVNGHKTNLIAKTGSKSTLDLLVYAIKNGLVSV